MCLAIPGVIESIFQQDDLLMAKVNFGGVRRNICLTYVPQAQVGQYVLVHVGFALSLIDEVEARRTLNMLDSNEIKAELEL
jgi:hydrogenase expression/formation protein HypC